MFVPIEREMVATRVNHQPASILGITSSEFAVLLVCGGLIFLTTAIGGFFFVSVFSAVIGLVLAAAFVYLAAARLRAVKRNRPDRYYVHAVWYHLAKKIPGLAGGVVLRSGVWVNGRDLTEK